MEQFGQNDLCLSGQQSFQMHYRQFGLSVMGLDRSTSEAPLKVFGWKNNATRII